MMVRHEEIETRVTLVKLAMCLIQIPHVGVWTGVDEKLGRS